ncbi:hypothetical protein MY8738_006655 [Beauveria namnaoensis]
MNTPIKALPPEVRRFIHKQLAFTDLANMAAVWPRAKIEVQEWTTNASLNLDNLRHLSGMAPVTLHVA